MKISSFSLIVTSSPVWTQPSTKLKKETRCLARVPDVVVRRFRNLVHDRVEVGVGESLLSTCAPSEPKIGREVGHVGCNWISRAGTAGEQADDASLPVDDNRPRITRGGECPVLVAVGVDGDFHRRTLDAMLIVHANERLYSDPATNSDSSGLTVFNDEKTLLAVSIELLRFVYFVFIDDGLDLQEAADGIFERGAALGMRVHFQDEVGG